MKMTELGRFLGISTAQVSRLAKRGMPTDSVDAARRWRQINLDSVRQREIPGNKVTHGAEFDLMRRRLEYLEPFTQSLIAGGEIFLSLILEYADVLRDLPDEDWRQFLLTLEERATMEADEQVEWPEHVKIASAL